MTPGRTIHVTDLMDVNAGDEQHDARNWHACTECGRDFPADYDACPWGCNEKSDD